MGGGGGGVNGKLFYVLDFFGPKKFSLFMAHPSNASCNGCCPHQNYYVPRHINNWYISTVVNRWLSFLVVVWFGSTPAPSRLSKLVRRRTGRLRKRDKLLAGEGEGGGRGVESYDRKKSLALYKLFNTLWLEGFPILTSSRNNTS
jgi:hypothetical protein